MHRRRERGRASALAVVVMVVVGCSAQSATSITADLSRRGTDINSGSSMQITRTGTQPSEKGPAGWFTGTVRIDPLFTAPSPARAAGATVTFEPGARTAWHTHPLGQTLVVMSGVGRVQTDGEPVAEIRPGDVVWIPPGERHWHGAAPTTAMTHIAIQEALDGKMVEWMEHVTEEQYLAAPRGP